MDYRQVTVHPESHIAPNATLVGQVEVAKDATILFNATLRGDYGSRIVVGEGSNVQENSCLHLDFNQDCIVGRGVTIGHRAVVHGCTLGDNVLVGMGAVVMNGAVIGANSLVAAGALVTEGTQVPEGSLVVGVPAKVRRQLTLEEIEGNREAARGYAAIGRDLAEQGILYWGADIPADARTIALAQD
ncbi:gamma carbonic anhydrase family protein [uncultured Adlercreutzia sp.]|uniref:gamma carbonic anhydrase family protein n=1 Tax=uncultured Adlercreutzia sp. TaxID=875803 RepID=UPI002589E9AA|nr:gamma carbonic anhydrase family protein [uncultured Adlercreutzia sp.]